MARHFIFRKAPRLQAAEVKTITGPEPSQVDLALMQRSWIRSAPKKAKKLFQAKPRHAKGL